jgi:hypothetical protein
MWVLFSVAVAGPANVNDGLVRWYRADLGVIGSTMVDQWNDQAGGSDARKSGNATRARRQLSAVLNQEILWFDGSDSLLFDGSPLVNSDYTVFVVAGRAGAGSEAYYLGGDSTLNDANFVAGYRDSTTLRVSHYGNPLSATVPAWTSGEDWHLQAYTLSSTGRTLHSDGPLVASDSDNGRLTGWNDARIGSYKANNKFFVGAMAEIVMYDRALDCSERNAVAEELSARWGVPWNSLDDADGDGACAPADCNDANPNVRPGAPEACNGVDDDCVGGAAGEGDGDGDGMRVCEGDCVDTDPSIPRAEQCNGIDDDCVAGVPVDERDLDGDGFRTCTGDCADTNNARYPGAVEVPGNGVDENCDGSDAAVCYDDDDDDGFGDTTVAGPVGCGSAGMAALNGDCDDLDDGLYPGAADRPDDGVDQDCSGADTVTCWADMGRRPVRRGGGGGGAQRRLRAGPAGVRRRDGLRRPRPGHVPRQPGRARRRRRPGLLRPRRRHLLDRRRRRRVRVPRGLRHRRHRGALPRRERGRRDRLQRRRPLRPPGRARRARRRRRPGLRRRGPVRGPRAQRARWAHWALGPHRARAHRHRRARAHRAVRRAPVWRRRHAPAAVPVWVRHPPRPAARCSRSCC